MKAVVVTNIPVPYRIPVYEQVDGRDGIDLTVIYLADRESNRQWLLPRSSVDSITLRASVLRVAGRYIHFSRGTWKALNGLRPDVVVTTGFNPPHLEAFAWCVVHRVPHVLQTDGTPRSERRLTFGHRIVRRLVARTSRGWLAASDAGVAMIEAWGAPRGHVGKSPLAVDNGRLASAARPSRHYDFLFSGQLTAVKDPVFALQVAARTADLLGRRVSIAFIGDGPLRTAVEEATGTYAERVDALVAGFQQQSELPGWYGNARMFLFPTRWEPWGLVLNEALAAGQVALVSPAAGSGAELIEQGVNGWVLPLDVDRWAVAAAEVLRDQRRLEAMSEAASRSVLSYSWQEAARAMRVVMLSARR